MIARMSIHALSCNLYLRILIQSRSIYRIVQTPTLTVKGSSFLTVSATIVPCGFSWAVSGIIIPDAVVVSAEQALQLLCLQVVLHSYFYV